MTLSLPQLRGHDVLTSSRMATYRACPKKHYFSYVLGIRPARIADYFRLGGNFHVGLDLRAQGKTQGEAILGAVSPYEVVPGWADTDAKVHEWMIERETVARLLSGYFWYWERDGIRADIHPVEIIETEVAFNLPIRNPDTGRETQSFRVAGKRDKIVKLADGRLAVMEHKTCGEDIDPQSIYWKRLAIDQQISLYMLAAREQGHDVQTVLYDVTRKPGIEPKQIPILDEDKKKIVLDAQGQRVVKSNILKNGTPGAGHGEPYQGADKEKGWVLQTRIETPEEFGNRLTDDIANRPEHYYQRQEIPRLDADLKEFAHELWQMQQQINEAIKKGRHFRNTNSCTLRGQCEYLGVCSSFQSLANGVPEGFRQAASVHEELE